MQKFKAIGWDLDDTLYQRRDFYQLAFETMQTSVHPIEQPFELFYEIFEQQSDIEYERFIREGKSKDAYRLDRVISTYKHLGHPLTEDEAIIFNALNTYFRERMQLDASIVKLLHYLKQAGYYLFILTNGPSIVQRQKLERLSINQWINEDDWFISEELNYSKPDIELFRHVEKSLGFASDEIAYIGDSFTNDIVGANKAGWSGIYYNHATNSGNITDYDQSITTFEDLHNYF